MSSVFNNIYKHKNIVLQRKWIESATFLPIATGKCSYKAIGQRMGTAVRVQENCWEMPKGIGLPLGNFQDYRKAAGKNPNESDKPQWANVPTGCAR